MILCFYGDGKGKTTAAVGIAVRAAGNGISVEFIKFMKGIESGEDSALERLGIDVRRLGRKRFVSKSSPSGEDEKLARNALSAVSNSNADIVIADEILTAFSFSLLGEDDVVSVARPFSRNEKRHIVMTGRSIGEKILDIADLATEMKKVKHYFDEGVFAMPGLEI